MPSVFGSAPIDRCCSASEVTPTYFRSAARSSEKLTQPSVTVAEQAGALPLEAASSKPATVDRTAVAPEPWFTRLPVNGSIADCCFDVGMLSDDGWVITEAGRGAAYTGTRRFGTPEPVSATRPLASAWYSRGRPPCWRSTVGSIVLVSLDGSSVSVTVTVLLARGSTVTDAGDTEYVAPGMLVRAW